MIKVISLEDGTELKIGDNVIMNDGHEAVLVNHSIAANQVCLEYKDGTTAWLNPENAISCKIVEEGQ